MRFPGGASFGARGRLAFRHRGAHRHRAARARHGEFGDFADPRSANLSCRSAAMCQRVQITSSALSLFMRGMKSSVNQLNVLSRSTLLLASARP